MRKPSSTDAAELFVLLQTLARDTNQNLHQIVQAYLSSDRNTFWNLSNGLVTVLGRAHSRAAYLGRLLAGNPGEFGTHDQLFGASAIAEQAPYLTALLQDLQAGRYGVRGQTDEIAALLAARLGMYVKRLRGTADEAWALNLPDGTLVNWVTTEAESCVGCVDMESANPHVAATMDKYPGSAQTPCLLSCQCYLETTDGNSGFPPITF